MERTCMTRTRLARTGKARLCRRLMTWTAFYAWRGDPPGQCAAARVALSHSSHGGNAVVPVRVDVIFSGTLMINVEHELPLHYWCFGARSSLTASRAPVESAGVLEWPVSKHWTRNGTNT